LNNVILSQALIDKWVADPTFFSKMPEFNVIRTQKSVYDTAYSKGCTNCKQRRQQRTVFNNAVAILLALNPGAMQRLKDYANTSQIQYRGMNPQTRKYEVKIL